MDICPFLIQKHDMFLLAVNWSELFANIGQFILAFSILVVLHEMGHFLPAKWFG
jgi:regulator of sigma E protease